MHREVCGKCHNTVIRQSHHIVTYIRHILLVTNLIQIIVLLYLIYVTKVFPTRWYLGGGGVRGVSWTQPQKTSFPVEILTKPLMKEYISANKDEKEYRYKLAAILLTLLLRELQNKGIVLTAALYLSSDITRLIKTNKQDDL